MSASRDFTRRRALLAGVAALGGAAWLSTQLGVRRKSATELGPSLPLGTDRGGTLVLIELEGGMDGLSAVAPIADDAYYRLRPKTHVAARDALGIDGLRGLHPSFAHLRARYDRGQVAIVEGVGYPEPNYSHFRSFEVWHTARPEGRASGDGWIGRLRATAFADDPRSELCVHVGPHLPYSLACAEHPALAFTEPGNLSRQGGEISRELLGEAAQAMDLDGEHTDVLEHLRARLWAAEDAASRVRSAAAAHEPHVEYPATALAQSLRTVAALLRSDLGTRVFSLQQGNYDTHGGSMKWKHQRLFRHLDEGLAAFFADLEGSSALARTVVVLFSEFGRRAAENESEGTDHGAAGTLFVIGPSVRGGPYGAQPSLSDLDRDGNLVHTIDFRHVYASLLEGIFGVPNERVLPGRFTPLPLLGPIA